MRLTFVAHFIIVLACLGALFFAWSAGVPQAVWENGVAGWFGLAIGILAMSAAIWLGWQAWLADSPPRYFAPGMLAAHQPERANASFGHYAELLCPAIGMLGTVVGLKMAFADAGDQLAMIRHAYTAFDATGCGIVGMIIVKTFTHNLEAGMRRPGR